MVESFSGLLPDGDTPDRTLAVLGDNQPEPVWDLLVDAFGNLGVDLVETDLDGDREERVVLIENDTVVATSPMESVRNAILLVNSDLYTTGLSGIERYEAPDVLTAMEGDTYTLRGFPESTKEKLLLIVMSRYIERRALEVDGGRLDVAFQRLSRIKSEYGTGRIYRRLSESEVEVHAYGVPDSVPADLDGIRFHTGHTEPYRKSWFVVFSPPDGRIDPAALFALQTDSNAWRSTWTYEPERVRSIRDRIERRF